MHRIPEQQYAVHQYLNVTVKVQLSTQTDKHENTFRHGHSVGTLVKLTFRSDRSLFDFVT